MSICNLGSDKDEVEKSVDIIYNVYIEPLSSGASNMNMTLITLDNPPAYIRSNFDSHLECHENHRYTPSPTIILAVPVMAALLLLIPNILLLALIAASASLSCEWPETYVAAPKPTKVAVPGVFSIEWMNEKRCIYQSHGKVCSLRTLVLKIQMLEM